jgi:WD40 repeat protein
MSSASASRRWRRPLTAVLAALAYLAIAAGLGTWWLWPPRPYITLPESQSTNHIEFSQDGTLIGGLKEDAVLVWDTATGLLRLVLRVDPTAFAFVFSPHGQLLAVRGERLRLFDLATGEERSLALPDPGVLPITFSPDGQTLVVAAGRDSVSLLNLTTGALWSPSGLRMQSGAPAEWGTGNVLPCRFSHDGRWLAWQDGGTLRVLDVAGQRELAAYPCTPAQLAFAPDGGAWAVADLNRIRVCVAPSGEERMVLRWNAAEITSLAWSPDGRRLASVGGHGSLELKLWDALEGKALAALTPQNPAGVVQFSPEGRLICEARSYNVRFHFDPAPGAGQGLVIAENSPVRLWDLRAAPPRHAATAVSLEEIQAPDGRVLATIGDADVPVEPWTFVRRVRAKAWQETSSKPWPSFTGDGKFVILSGSTITERGRLGIWLTRLPAKSDSYQYKWVDVDTWQVRGVLDLDGSGTLSPDGRMLATGGTDGPIQLWHVPPRRPLGPTLVLVGLIAASFLLIARQRVSRPTHLPPPAPPEKSPARS